MQGQIQDFERGRAYIYVSDMGVLNTAYGHSKGEGMGGRCARGPPPAQSTEAKTMKCVGGYILYI